MELIGRVREKAELKRLLESGKPEFLAVYGRRRVGKTYLIRRFFNDSFAFFFTGIRKGGTEVQLARFDEALTDYGAECGEAPDNWYQAFRKLKKLLEKRQKLKRTVIFLDEMPWMDTPKSGFLSALEYFWNDFCAMREDVLLIVCGSVSSWIVKNLFKNRGGLHNRVTSRILLLPFNLGECEQFFNSMNVRMNRYQIIESYMIFGGVPYYMSLFKKEIGLSRNVDCLVFDKSAPLADEYNEMFASLFRRPERHMAIVEALNMKRSGLTRDEIIKETGIPAGGNLTKTIEELEQCGFISKYEDFSHRKNKGYYVLMDSFTLFLLKFRRGYNGKDENFWSNYVRSSSYRAWSGMSFEMVCLWHLAQIKHALGISGVFSHTTSWRSQFADPGAQIDLLIDRRDQIINLCEIKYSDKLYKIDKNTDRILQNKIIAFRTETNTNKAIHLTLVTTYGIASTGYWRNVQTVVTAEDLFALV